MLTTYPAQNDLKKVSVLEERIAEQRKIIDNLKRENERLRIDRKGAVKVKSSLTRFL